MKHIIVGRDHTGSGLDKLCVFLHDVRFKVIEVMPGGENSVLMECSCGGHVQIRHDNDGGGARIGLATCAKWKLLMKREQLPVAKVHKTMTTSTSVPCNCCGQAAPRKYNFQEWGFCDTCRKAGCYSTGDGEGGMSRAPACPLLLTGPDVAMCLQCDKPLQ